MAKKSKDSCTFYPLSDPKHCRKPQQEDSRAVEVGATWPSCYGEVAFPKKVFIHDRHQYAVYLFMDGKLELRLQAVDLPAFHH